MPNILNKVKIAALMKWRKGDVTIARSTEKIRGERRKAAEWGAKEALNNVTSDFILTILEDHSDYDSTYVDNCICGMKVKAGLIEHQSQIIAESIQE